MTSPVPLKLAFALSLAAVALPAGAAERELPAAASKKIDFAKDIKPILEASCVKCHADGKRKGGFSIDHIHSLLAGGESGPAVKKGKSADSLLIELVLGNDPDTRMPNKGKILTLEQVALLRAWIDQGVAWEKGFTFATFRDAPVEPREVELPEGPEANPIDRLLGAYFKKTNVATKSPVSDAVFARRAYLDVIGLLPTPAELDAFAADKSPDKRAKLVANLLADTTNYSEHWVSFWGDALRNSYSRQYHGGGGKAITGWLKKSLADNKPYDQFVRELISPVAGSDGFILGVRWRGTINASQTPEMQAAQNVSQVFLGLNIKCASCHDSFINNWTLKQTYDLAAIFADGPLDVHRCNKPNGEKSTPAFLYPDLGSLDAKAPKAERVKQLAAIMTSKKNGRLARTMVNRLWAIFLGRGLVEPVDEMDNPTWNQDLLDWLANDFVAHNYDLKHTINLILTSQAYQRPSVPLDLDADADEFVFEGPVVRRLSAEQFLDSLDQVVLAATSKGEASRSTGGQRAALRKLDPLMRSLGRPKRDVVVTRRESNATTAQLLELSNGPAISALMAKGGKAWMEAEKDPARLTEALFRSALGRTPSNNERDTARSILGSPLSPAGIEDLFWVLAMHPEFQLIH